MMSSFSLVGNEDGDDECIDLFVSSDDEVFVNHYNPTRSFKHDDNDSRNRLKCPPPIHSSRMNDACRNESPPQYVTLGHVDKYTRPSKHNEIFKKKYRNKKLNTLKVCRSDKCEPIKKTGMWDVNSCSVRHRGEGAFNFMLRTHVLRNMHGRDPPRIVLNSHPCVYTIGRIVECMRKCGPDLHTVDIVVEKKLTMNEFFENRQKSSCKRLPDERCFNNHRYESIDDQHEDEEEQQYYDVRLYNGDDEENYDFYEADDEM